VATGPLAGVAGRAVRFVLVRRLTGQSPNGSATDPPIGRHGAVTQAHGISSAVPIKG
jgi:hypothetical protein